MAGLRRQERVNEAIKKTLWKMIQEELDQPLLISILEVKTSPDLQWADVFVSIFPFIKRSEGMRYLERKAPHFQFILNKVLNIRHTPKIRFKEDYRLELEDYGKSDM